MVGGFNAAVELLKRRIGGRLLGVALFGSVARGDCDDRSDVDVFVVTRGLDAPPGERLRLIYEAVSPLRRVVGRDVSVVTVEADELVDVTPLLVNIAYDAVILYDPEGFLRRFFERVRAAVEKAGLTPYTTKDGKRGWKPLRKLRRGEVVEVRL